MKKLLKMKMGEFMDEHGDAFLLGAIFGTVVMAILAIIMIVAFNAWSQATGIWMY